MAGGGIGLLAVDGASKVLTVGGVDYGIATGLHAHSNPLIVEREAQIVSVKFICEKGMTAGSCSLIRSRGGGNASIFTKNGIANLGVTTELPLDEETFTEEASVLRPGDILYVDVMNSDVNALDLGWWCVAVYVREPLLEPATPAMG